MNTKATKPQKKRAKKSRIVDIAPGLPKKTVNTPKPLSAGMSYVSEFFHEKDDTTRTPTDIRETYGVYPVIPPFLTDFKSRSYQAATACFLNPAIRHSVHRLLNRIINLLGIDLTPWKKGNEFVSRLNMFADKTSWNDYSQQLDSVEKKVNGNYTAKA